MEKLETIKRKIGSAEDMQSVVKTMKSLAAVNIRQYEEAVNALRDFSRVIERGLQAALRARPWVIRRMSEAAPDGRAAAVVFGSEQGMAGQFNEQIGAHAAGRLDKEFGRERTAVLTVGDRVSAQMTEAGFELYERLPFPGSLAGVSGGLFRLLSKIEALRFEQGFRTVVLYHNTPTSGASYKPVSRRLLPLNRGWLKELGEREWPTRMIPLYTMHWESLFADLVRELMFVSLMRAYIESLASENASRLSSMQVAEKNIGERLDELHQQFNRQRQSSITAELLDIVAGFEALTD